MKTLIKNVRVYPDGKNHYFGSIVIEDDHIYALNEEVEVDEVIDGKSAILIPGMIDIHLHGSYGYDFIRDPQISVDAVSKGLLKEGTTAFLASLTVVPHGELCTLLKEYKDVKSPDYAARYLGVHSEGPYLSADYKALMKEEWLQEASLEDFKELLECAGDALKVMTIAPEKKGAKEVIEYASEKGVAMMIGHTATPYKDAMDAINKGVKGFTHLYNAMTQHSHRDPGAVTAAFDSNTFVEIIPDGFHTNEAIVRTSYKIFQKERIIIITDAMIAKGMEDGFYTFSELNCEKHGNTVQVKETGRIAGSCITQIEALQYMKAFTGCDMNDLVQMACVNPAKLLKVDDQIGSLEKNKKADFVLLSDELEVLSTYVEGRLVYQKA